MLELRGKHATAKVFTDVVDQNAISQVIDLLNQPYAEGSNIRMMPDIHAGAGCTIGTTMTITDKICPNLVGVDIGCGMEVVMLRETVLDCKKLDEVIRKEIPFGFEIRSEEFNPETVVNHDRIDLRSLYCAKKVNLSRAYRSIGTLGGGNHFIEADRDDDGNIYIVVHTGSRHLGLEVANHYQEEAYKALTSLSKERTNAIVSELTAEGRQKEIQKALQDAKKNASMQKVPKHLAYVEGELFKQYIHDMAICQRYAMQNRFVIMDTILKNMGLHEVERFTTIHNYIDTVNMVLRKGSVSAQRGEKLIIPINMRDGSLICVGKGNRDWNYSAPHGAGRLMSRSEAKQNFSVEEFAAEMEGIYTTSVGQGTLDECPMAYKSIEDIVGNIEPTVDIVKVIKPIYNFKAGG